MKSREQMVEGRVQKAQGKSPDGSRGQHMAAEEAESNREQNKAATRVNAYREQRAESMHRAQNKSPECGT